MNSKLLLCYFCHLCLAKSSLFFRIWASTKPPSLCPFGKYLVHLPTTSRNQCTLVKHQPLLNSSPVTNIKGSYPLKKMVKKGDIVHFWRPPPPKQVKRGHLLSDYRQKCVNGTRDSYCCVKSPFLSDLRIR